MWWIYALLSAVFAALTTILAKVGIKGVNSDLATAIRTLVVVIVAWIIVWSKREAKGLITLTQVNWIFLILSGLATGFSWLCYFKALQLGDVSKVAPTDKLSVALAIVLSVIFLGETLTVKTAIGASLIIVGTMILIL
ncbi:EamA family transporter [Xanthocytophaga flava]|uniref:EamA family transporter n=1 Tax=Xanthocytophaga flava TaxID=3048013 RepID=UPI0028D32EAC|nr:EamA family transporter [Xanthocytophaga flavus]MDJ1467935.1 EamA family transporter [Xanthocytophaga flavus]